MIDFTSLPRRAGYEFSLNWAAACGYQLYKFSYTGETREKTVLIHGVEQTFMLPVIEQKLAHTFPDLDQLGEFLGDKARLEYPNFQVPAIKELSDPSLDLDETVECKSCESTGQSKEMDCTCVRLGSVSSDCEYCLGLGRIKPRCYYCNGKGHLSLVYNFDLSYQEKIYPITIDLRKPLPQIMHYGREVYAIAPMVQEQLPEILQQTPLIIKTNHGWRKLQTLFGAVATNTIADPVIELAKSMVHWQSVQGDVDEFEVTSMLPAEITLGALEDIARLHDVGFSIVMREGNIGMCEFGWQLYLVTETVQKEIAIDYDLETSLHTALAYMQTLGENDD